MAQRGEAAELEIERTTGGAETLLHGRYVVERTLRRDRLTTVYLARASEGSEGASLVWTVHPGMVARSDRAARAFVETMREVEAITHGAIPSVQCVEGDDPGPTVVAARAPGRTLREQLDSGVMLAPPEVGRMVESVAGALGALHRASIVHRALSPERVLLEPDPFRVWLEEAGYLHALVAAGFITERATADLVRPGYLLPEECSPIGSRGGDAYALAVLAFEALSGRLPFGTLRGADLHAALRAPELPSPRSFRALLPEAVDGVFERALGVAHGRGFEGPEDFARALCMAIEPDGAMRLTMPHDGPIPREAVGDGPVEHLDGTRETGQKDGAEAVSEAAGDSPPEAARDSYDRVSLEAIVADDVPEEQEGVASPVAAPEQPRPALSVAPPRRPSQPSSADEHAPAPERPRSTPPPLPRAQTSLAPSRRTLRGVYAVANDTGARMPPAPRLPSDLTALSVSQSELTPVVGYEALRASASRAERIAAAEAGSATEDADDEGRASLVELPTSVLEESTTGVVTAPADLPPPEPPTQVLPGGSSDATLVDAPLSLRPSQRAGSPLRAPSESSPPVVRPARTPAGPAGASRRPAPRAGGELALRARTPASGRPAAPAQVARARDDARELHEDPEADDALHPGAMGASSAASELTAALQRGARLLAGATVLSALVATVGLVYAARSVDEVLLAAQTGAGTVVGPSAQRPEARPSQASPPAETHEAAQPSPAAVAPPPPVALAPSPPVAPPEPPAAPVAPTPAPAPEAPPPPPPAPVAVAATPAVSGPTALQRAMVAAQMRSGVADCVMGMEGRAFSLGLRIEPGTGRVSRVRLRGAFNEPPVSTCIEDIARTVRVPPFEGDAWDFFLVFPIPRGG